MLEKILPSLQDKFEETFDTPTPIQNAVWEDVLNKKSIFGLAPTGTGKTLAFVLPLLTNIDVNLKRTQVLILAPSQELAMQLSHVIREWATLVPGVNVVSLVGGANGRRQADKLKKEHPQIVIGTLGRVLTMAESGALKLKNIQSVVFDEADVMLSEERYESINQLAEQIPDNIQLMLFSATSGVDLQYVNQTFGQSVVPVSVGTDAPANIQHEFQYVDQRAKAKVLIQLARNKQQALVFFNSIRNLVAMQSTLQHANAKVTSLGGNDRRHIQRADALRSFKKGDVSLLLVTDVAARGLDIVDLPLVVNAQLPENKETYIHRTGRTGRMGKSGRVLNLGNDHDVRNLKRTLGDDFTLVPAKTDSISLVSDDKQQPKVVKKSKDTTILDQKSVRKPVLKSKPKPSNPINDSKPKRKKNRQNKDKGKPKWAKA